VNVSDLNNSCSGHDQGGARLGDSHSLASLVTMVLDVTDPRDEHSLRLARSQNAGMWNTMMAKVAVCRRDEFPLPLNCPARVWVVAHLHPDRGFCPGHDHEGQPVALLLRGGLPSSGGSPRADP